MYILNLDVAVTQGVDLNQFDSGELDDLVIDNLIEYVARAEFDKVVQIWISKLAHGGKIKFVFDDIMMTINELSTSNDISKINHLIFGPPTKVGFKCLVMSGKQMKETLSQFGLKVDSISYSGNKVTVVGVRP